MELKQMPILQFECGKFSSIREVVRHLPSQYKKPFDQTTFRPYSPTPYIIAQDVNNGTNNCESALEKETREPMSERMVYIRTRWRFYDGWGRYD